MQKEKYPNSLANVLKKAKRYKTDWICISTSRNCSFCGTYNLRTYSISGKDRRFPPLSVIPAELTLPRCSQCNRCIGYVLSFVDTKTPNEQKKDIEFSNRPFDSKID